MGACLSKKESSAKKKPSLKRDPPVPAPPQSLSPPLPEEEAVVKEVLTETPMPSSATTRSNSRRAPEDTTPKSPGKAEPASAAATEDEASEMCTVSDCFSASTALTEKRSVANEEAEAGEEETSAPPPKWWPPPEWSSPSGKAYHDQRRRSPARRDPRPTTSGAGTRSSPSPARRAEGRPFPGNGNAAAVTWKGHGDRSGRRSVSPAAKQLADPRANGGGVSRSSSMRKPGAAASPRRARPAPASAPAGSVVRMVGPAGGEEALPPPARQKDSVENPLVSLECFIFL